MSKLWAPADEFVLRKLYANHTAEALALIVGRTASQVYAKAKTMGLSKSAAFLASPASGRLDGRDNGRRFMPGQVPANKGLRRPGWAPGRMASTQFKPGRQAHEARNYLPIGSERITRDGILERKVTDDPSMCPARRWVAVTRLVWEAANGPIPAGHLVAFKPGRKTTDAAAITADALELVSRAELMRRNTRHRYPPELNQLLALKGALTRKINNRTRSKTA